MELNKKMSNALKISVAIVAVILLLVIGAAFGARVGHYRYAFDNNSGCAFNRFDRDDRQDSQRFRMMRFQDDNFNQNIQGTPGPSCGGCQGCKANLANPISTSTLESNPTFAPLAQ